MQNWIKVFNYIDGTEYPNFMNLNKIKYIYITPLQRKTDPVNNHAIIVRFTDGEEKMYCLKSFQEALELFNQIETINQSKEI